jgi:hypothetical protein
MPDKGLEKRYNVFALNTSGRQRFMLINVPTRYACAMKNIHKNAGEAIEASPA